jgi:hypothetical protein
MEKCGNIRGAIESIENGLAKVKKDKKLIACLQEKLQDLNNSIESQKKEPS